MNEQSIIRLEHISKHYISRKGVFRKTIENKKAVDDVSFTLKKGESLGLVGESGCGKSTLARTILRLTPITSGEIFYKNDSIARIPERHFRRYRKEIQMVFQDPYASLNPRMTVFDILAEPLLHYRIVSRRKLSEEIAVLMETVGLSPTQIKKYPHEFSGGQRQRIAIAKALSIKPELLIADEPVSALDVSVQAQILNLISSLKEKMNLSMIFISHNLAVVKHICSRIAVMKSGRIVETGNADDIFDNPKHDYTKLLLASIPDIQAV